MLYGDSFEAQTDQSKGPYSHCTKAALTRKENRKKLLQSLRLASSSFKVSPTQYAVPTRLGLQLHQRWTRHQNCQKPVCPHWILWLTSVPARTTTPYGHTFGKPAWCAVLGRDPILPSLLQIGIDHSRFNFSHTFPCPRTNFSPGPAL